MPGTFSAVPVVATGDWITAGWVNTYVGGNLAALWAGVAAGDTEYYISAVEKARLAKPSVDSLLGMGSAGAPYWLSEPNVPGLIHAQAAVYWTGEYTRNSSTYADVTGATVNIVTTVPCTIVMRAEGHIANATAGNRTTVQGVIGGVADANHDDTKPWTTNVNYVPYAYTYKLAGVAPGTITCKLQFKGVSTAYINAGRILIDAIPE